MADKPIDKPNDKPNDRLKESAPKGDEPEPKVYLVVSGEKFVRPSLETYYAKSPKITKKKINQTCSCDTVSGTYCQCNKVCTCNLVCTCQKYKKCSCVGYSKGRRKSGSYCSCNKVCSCVPVH